MISKIKNTVLWTYVINNLNGEEINGTELQKLNYDYLFSSWIDDVI